MDEHPTADPWSSATASDGAPPPPPPPPPVAGHDLAERLTERVVALERDVAGLEREVAGFAEFRDQVTERLAALGSGRQPRSEAEVVAGDEALREARARIDLLEHQLEEALRARSIAPASGEELEALRGKLGAVEARHTRLLAEHEKLMGDHQALKLLHTETAKRTALGSGTHPLSGPASGTYPRADVPTTGDPKIDQELQALSTENAKLREELSLVKREATTRIKSLKASADRHKVDAETMKMQKDNLLKELATRDGGEGQTTAPKPLTLEEITASDVFKTMLGNIRRTSREEVTHLHDAVAKLRTIHPDGYKLLLELVARQFANAGVENPLALLPKT